MGLLSTSQVWQLDRSDWVESYFWVTLDTLQQCIHEAGFALPL